MLRQSSISTTMSKRPNSRWIGLGVTSDVGVVGHAWYCLPSKNDTVFSTLFTTVFSPLRMLSTTLGSPGVTDFWINDAFPLKF